MQNNEMKLTKPAIVNAAPVSQLISVFSGHYCMAKDHV
jgi:hypothetical protein